MLRKKLGGIHKVFWDHIRGACQTKTDPMKSKSAKSCFRVSSPGVQPVSFCHSPPRPISGYSFMQKVKGREKTAVQEPLPGDTGANDHQPCVSNALPLEVEMHNSAWAACASLPRLTERAVWSLVLAGITPRCPSASFSGLLSSACKTRNPPLPTQSPEQ